MGTDARRAGSARTIRAINQICLVQDDDVGKRDLGARLLAVLELLIEMPRIHHRDDSIQREFLAHSLIDEKSLRDRPGVGKAGGLQDDAIEFVPPRDQIAQDANQVAAHGATDAPVVHFEDLFFGVDHEFLIDADLAEFVLDDGDALTVAFGEDAIQKGRLAGAQEAGQHGHRNSIRFTHDYRLPSFAKGLRVEPHATSEEE